jgi:hypothetical protein
MQLDGHGPMYSSNHKQSEQAVEAMQASTGKTHQPRKVLTLLPKNAQQARVQGGSLVDVPGMTASAGSRCPEAPWQGSAPVPCLSDLVVASPQTGQGPATSGCWEPGVMWAVTRQARCCAVLQHRAELASTCGGIA